MFLLGNRQDEILSRAKNRTVTALVNISAPGVEPGSLHGLFGMIVEKGRPALPTNEVHAQSSHMWQMSDTCETLAEKDADVLAEILDELAKRMASLKSPKFVGLNFDSQKIVFNSEDLVERANGIPSRLHIDFKGEAAASHATIARLPFPKLQSYLSHLEEKVEQIGGRIHSADIAHGPSMSAFDYYEMATKKYVAGQKFTYGHVMLARATNLLQQIGIPFVEAPKPSAKPH